MDLSDHLPADETMALFVSNARTLGRDVADRFQRLLTLVSPALEPSLSFCSGAFTVPSVFNLLSLVPFAAVLSLPAFLNCLRQPVHGTARNVLEGVGVLAAALCSVLTSFRTDFSKFQSAAKTLRRLPPLSQTLKASKGTLALEDVPEFMRHNVYIKTGYRNYRTRTQCLRGIFSWHNESVNIWSHLIALVALVSLTVDDLKTRYDQVAMSLPDRWLCCLMSASYGTMLTLSALYHVFNCRSEAAFRFWYLWDFFGIWLSMLAYVAGFTVLQLRGYILWQCFYLSLQALMATAMGLITFAPPYRDQAWDPVRTRAVGGVVLFSLVPLAHSVCLNPDHIVRATVGGHGSVLAILVLSFLIFTTKFPESRLPGSVDLLGSSHQMWHLGILLSVLIAHELYFSYVAAYNRVMAV